ncbi:hypothetical protein [Chelatococcus reniformis]|uniref:Uncharacterized protein n=1 Tax=Chelatococcus reniformis TaxID=1494448 RepID=A0A916UVQ8_9HYPH|nr:hypothetical protein [Chelatococcus reniformis]GGC90849.1 hypothetical protein GCM10010994_55810 [Chelatococcus reniformis]
MGEILSFRSTRAAQVAAASVNLADKPMSECLAFWAEDLRGRGLTTEASYFDAALVTIRSYERSTSVPSRSVQSRD